MDRKSRSWVFATGALVVAATAVAAVQWPRLKAWVRPPTAALPRPADVVRMEGTVWAAGSQGQLESDVPRFEVPADIARRVWDRFDPYEYVAKPAVDPDAPLGELLVTAASGKVTRLLFYETGHQDVVFTTDGNQFFRAEPRNAYGNPLGGARFVAGTLRAVWAAGLSRERSSDAAGAGFAGPRAP